MPWLYRRTRHPDTGVRVDTPRWLVVVLPQRTLVEQIVAAVRSWVSALGVDVGVHVLMGGISADDADWRCTRNVSVFVGTQDMVLCRGC